MFATCFNFDLTLLTNAGFQSQFSEIFRFPTIFRLIPLPYDATVCCCGVFFS